MHLGNYLGAFRNWARLQDEYDALYCVVDRLHAITVWQDPLELQNQIREAAAAYMASGVDPSRSILYNQSKCSGPRRTCLDFQLCCPAWLVEPHDPVQG